MSCASLSKPAILGLKPVVPSIRHMRLLASSQRDRTRQDSCAELLFSHPILFPLGRELSTAHQYGLAGGVSFPFFWLAGAGSAVFWVLGEYISPLSACKEEVVAEAGDHLFCMQEVQSSTASIPCRYPQFQVSTVGSGTEPPAGTETCLNFHFHWYKLNRGVQPFGFRAPGPVTTV